MFVLLHTSTYVLTCSCLRAPSVCPYIRVVCDVPNRSHRRSVRFLRSQKESLGFLEAADYSVPAEDRLAFERNGHVATRAVFSSEQLETVRPSVVRGVSYLQINVVVIYRSNLFACTYHHAR